MKFQSCTVPKDKEEVISLISRTQAVYKNAIIAQVKILKIQYV